MAVQYLLYLRKLWFPARTLSLSWRWTQRTGCQPFQRNEWHENYGIVLASLYVLNNRNRFWKLYFSNTQHFALYISCMPSRRLWWLDAPLMWHIVQWLQLLLHLFFNIFYLNFDKKGPLLWKFTHFWGYNKLICPRAFLCGLLFWCMISRHLRVQIN